MRAIFITCCRKGQAIRYGVTVGDEALAFSGVAKVGNMQEWPNWTPTPDIKKRLGNIPSFVSGGPHNPLGARAIYLYEGNKDTLYPYSRHQSAGIHRPCDFIWLYPV